MERRQGLDVNSFSLLTSNLRTPRTPEHYVRRQRLFALLDHAVQRPITVVAAPAGSGKTALLSGWVAETATRATWLSLDEVDRDPVRFWFGVIGALEKLMPGCGSQAVQCLRRANGVQDGVAALLGDLDSDGPPEGALVVDDLHFVVVDDVVAASLEQFLLHLPPWLHVVLLCRHQPRLPVDRLQACGLLSEVHFAELTFSATEARELLCRLAPSLAADQVEAVASHAIGWAAGLQLAALAARAAEARGGRLNLPDEADQMVSDYVMHEVLAGESSALVDALLDFSVVERLDRNLAIALSGREDAGELLAQAEARGLFITRIGTTGWSQLHALFRSTLLAELAKRAPLHLTELHARAAEWFEQADEVPLALEHWFLADQPREALRLLAAQNAMLYDNGLEETITRNLTRIPPDVAGSDLDAMLEFAWCNLLVDRRRFVQTVDKLGFWAKRVPSLESTAWGRLFVLQSIAATTSADWVTGAKFARQALAELGDNWRVDMLGRFVWNMIARDVALSERWDNAGDEVLEVELALSRDTERLRAFEGTRALGEALAGRPVDALRIAAGVRRVANITNMTILRAELSIAEAIAHRELADLPRAIAELEILSEISTEPALYCRVLAAVELTHARLDGGDLSEARSAFDQAEALVGEDFGGPGGRSWLARAGTRLALAEGRLDQARLWVEQDPDPFWSGIGSARLELEGGDRDAARLAIDAVEPRCMRHEVIRDLLRARVVETPDEAAKCVMTALDRATSVSILQTVASEGPEVLDFIEHAAWRVPRAWSERLRRAIPRSAKFPARHDLLEPLTDRERDVLRFLPSRLSLPEIAEELYISVNTLKFHLKRIYRKLGVTCRDEAAAWARRLASPASHHSRHT